MRTDEEGTRINKTSADFELILLKGNDIFVRAYRQKAQSIVTARTTT